MPDSSIPHDFAFGAAPGDNWPAIMGDPGEEAGIEGATQGRVDKSEVPRLRYPTHDLWYLSGFWLDQPTTATATKVASNVTANTLYATPFPTNGGGIIRAVRYYSSGATGTTIHFRVGIYKPTSNANIYPGQLLWQGPSTAWAGTTTYDFQVNKSVSSQSVAWLAFVRETGTIGGSILSANPTEMDQKLIGADPPTTAAGSAISTPFTYATLPSTFPTTYSALSGTTVVPCAWIQFQQ